MNLVSSDQNAKLKNAGSQPVDTLPKIGKSINLSSQVAYSKTSSNNTISNDKKEIITPESKPRMPSDEMKGSYEGYMRSSPAHIQPNNAGYDNPANQQARYAQSKMQLDNHVPFLNLNKTNNSAIIDNYSSSLKRNSSGDRLKKMNNVERMF